MNCREFEANVTELANGVLNGLKQNEALAHARSCRRCGAVLESERRLSADLRALASLQGAEEAPPDFERRLVSVFRAQAAGKSVNANSAAGRSGTVRRPVPNHFPRAHPILRNWRLWGATAAGLVLGILAFSSLRHRPAVRPAEPAAQTRPTAPVNPGPEIPVPRPPSFARTAASQAALERAPVGRRAQAQPQKARPRPERPIERQGVIEAEISTDFYAIPYVEPALPGETMRIVRTRVPRSSLAAFGFPVNSDRAFDTIQADVLVGEDNIARAVRFVQQWQLPRAASGATPVNARYVR